MDVFQSYVVASFSLEDTMQALPDPELIVEGCTSDCNQDWRDFPVGW